MRVTGFIRRTRRLTALLAVAMTAGALYLWQGQAGAATGQAPVFSAVQLSDAVLFNEGPAAAFLATLNRGQVPWTDNLRAGQSAVNQAISRNQGFAVSFATRLQSGDPVRVKSALHDLAVLARSAFNQRLGAAAVEDAIRRLINEVYGQSLYDFLRMQRVIPFTLSRQPSFPCCLEPWVDPLASSVLVAFVDQAWELPGISAQVSQLIQEVTVRTATEGLRV